MNGPLRSNPHGNLQVSAVLQEQLLPKYLAIFTCSDKSIGEGGPLLTLSLRRYILVLTLLRTADADKHANQFIKDMSREINEKIVPMLYEDLGDPRANVDFDLTYLFFTFSNPSLIFLISYTQ